MPKSKKNKIVHLTQVKKKGKDHKEDLKKQLEEYASKYKNVFVFNFDGAKSDRIMNLRLRLKEHGRIFAGRNSIMKLTLKEYASKNSVDLDKIAKQVTGHRGLLFADIELQALKSLLDSQVEDFRDRLISHAKISTKV